jgi:hypothetical protein
MKTRIYLHHPGWLCNHLKGWSAAFSAIEQRPDVDDVTLIVPWPGIYGNLILPKTQLTQIPPKDEL